MTRHDSGGAPAKHAAALAELEPVSAYPLGVSVPNLMLRISHGKPVEGAPSDLVASWPGIVRKLGLDRHRTYSDKLAARWLIGATSTTGRTTAGSFEQFAIAALDFDDNPPADLPARFAALGVDGAVFETWRSTPAAPRYRVLVPLSAPVSADHYPDVVLVIAYLLGALDSLDEHSLETARKMFVPSVPKGQTRPAPLVIAAGAYLDTAKALELADDANAAYTYGSGAAATSARTGGAPHGASATVRQLCQQFGGLTNAAIVDTMRATTEGSRHDALVAASYVLAAHGANADEFDALTDAAVAAGLTDSEVKSASAGAASAGQADLAAKFPALDWDTIDETIDQWQAEAEAKQTVTRSWGRHDIGAIITGHQDGTIQPTRPTIGELRDADGEIVGALFYRHKVNTLIGESGSGKSWTALVSCAQELTYGAGVIYLDYEDSPLGIGERLATLGITAEEANRFAYYRPDTRFDAEAKTEMTRVMADIQPSLVVIDSIGESLAIEGLGPNDDDAVATWFTRIARWFTSQPCAPCVVFLDHPVKNPEQRGKYSGGSHRKRDAVDGCQIFQTLRTGFDREHYGSAALTVGKDRVGDRREGTPAGSLVFDAEGFQLMAPASSEPVAASMQRPIFVMESVSQYLEENAAEPAKRSQRQIRKALPDRNPIIDAALKHLVSEGFVSCEPGGPGRATTYTSIGRFESASEVFDDGLLDGLEDPE